MPRLERRVVAGAGAQTTDLDYQLAYQRAIEAVIWSMPAISIREFQETAFRDYGVSWNDVVLWSKPAVPRHELLTANNQVPYMLTFLNLRQGPMVVEIPAAGAKAVLFGSFVDNWQAPIVDVGPSGEDEGRGGKYLFLPPGYSEPIPDGYLPRADAGLRSRRRFASGAEPAAALLKKPTATPSK